VGGPSPRPTLISVGHGARAIDVFLNLVRGAGVERVVDVRSAPGSRKHPHFGKDALAASLAEEGMEYRWERDLGGWRRPRPGSPHSALRSGGFQGYADHMESDAFTAAVDRLVESGFATRTAFMCSESLWWRCHRRLLSDALTIRGCEVLHLMEGGQLERHRLPAMARVDSGRLVYDVEEGQQELPT
jgi:uncharacterized protein (DUF488 family)